MNLVAVVTIFILAVFVGLEVISKVPQTLHTPLMSATNAIHGGELRARLHAGSCDSRLAGASVLATATHRR